MKMWSIGRLSNVLLIICVLLLLLKIVRPVLFVCLPITVVFILLYRKWQTGSPIHSKDWYVYCLLGSISLYIILFYAMF
ncbi:MAG: hypothetical protein ACRC5C_14260 [Bacilli bacterium]